MLNRIETIKIINAVDSKYKEPEKLSFLSTEDTFTIYKKHKLVRVSLEEIHDIVDINMNLISEKRSQYDIIAEYLMNKLYKMKRPFPDVKEKDLEKVSSH